MNILLDNTVLSNFALVGESGLLQEIFGSSAKTTEEVMSEFREGEAIGRVPHTSWPWLAVLSLTSAERELYQKLLVRLNSGEASCLAVAYYRQGWVVTDDKIARKIAAQLQLSISGTIGVLVQLVRQNQLSHNHADHILDKMIEMGYRAPVQSINEIIKAIE